MAEEFDAKLMCKNCRTSGYFTSPVAVILVYAPGLERPYPLIPSEDYRICSKCDAVFSLVDRAVESHSVTSAAGAWTRAILIFIDGQGLDVAAKRDSPRFTGKVALA